jgi:anti-sigma regulatory factor (Ser/Thr protein kinase)
MNIKASRTFPADIPEIENVYAFISQTLSENGIGPAIENLFNLAVDEIFSNIVRYGYASDASRPTADAAIQITVQIDGDGVSMTFRDRGEPFDPLQARPPDLSLAIDERPVGGLGIYIVKNTFDDVCYAFEDGFNIFTLKKLLDKKGNRRGTQSCG